MQLQVNQLSFSFGSRCIFSDVSFIAKSGEIWHIQGDNGCGKSTLLQSILGLLHPSKGSCKITDAQQIERDIRTVSSFVPPDANGLWGSLSALENLHYWTALQRPSNEAKFADLTKLLADWGIRGVLAQQVLRVDRFSTGMKRRLCFARLFQLDTWLWVLDEPLFGLDSSGTALVIQAIKAHLEQGGACLLVTHDAGPFGALPIKSLALADFKPSSSSATLATFATGLP